MVATDLSNDHKPDLPAERDRILQAGGVVTAQGPGGKPPSRVWADGRVGLAMSRSIGDGIAKKFGVIAEAEVTRTKLTAAPDGDSDGDVVIIVASDGVWEFISSQEAVEIVTRFENASGGCAALVQPAQALRAQVLDEARARLEALAVRCGDCRRLQG